MSTSSLKTRNRLLWTAQILVGLLFVFAGAMKFIMPAEKMQQGPSSSHSPSSTSSASARSWVDSV